MDIPFNAKVECTDGPCGQSANIVINPITQQVTHVVVKNIRFPHTERLVPLEQVIATASDSIRLGCTRAEMQRMDPFLETEFIEPEAPDNVPSPFLMHPYVMPENLLIPMEHERIPAGELAVRRGAKVQASDGRVGRLDEFMIDPVDGRITHLVLREGHLWSKKDVAIPVSEIERFEEDVVYLKLDKHSIEQLPTIPVWRRYVWQEKTGPEPKDLADHPDISQTSATIEDLMTKLADEDGWVRWEARRRLVKVGKPAVAPLLVALGDSNHQVRWEAAKAVGQIGDPVAAEVLVNALEDNEFDIRWLAAVALIAIGREGLPSLLQALIEHSDSVLLREGAHHVLRSLVVGDLNPIVTPILAAIESTAPVATSPLAAYDALEALGNASN